MEYGMCSEKSKIAEDRCNDEGQLAIRKVQVLSVLRVLAAFMTVCGLLNLGVGIAIVILSEGGKQPVKSYVQIWTSCQVLIGAVAANFIGVFYKDNTEKGQKKLKYLIWIFYGAVVGACGTMGWGLGNAIWGVVVCGEERSECGNNPRAELALYGAAVPLSFLLWIGCITVTVVFNCFRRQLTSTASASPSSKQPQYNYGTKDIQME